MAGGAGAVAGEIAGEFYRSTFMNDLDRDSPAWHAAAARGADIARISAIGFATICGLDPSIAAHTAGQAAENNCFVPALMALGATAEGAAAIAAGSGALIEATIFVLNAAGLTYIAHDVHEAYQRGGFEAAKHVLSQHAGLYLSTRGAYGVGVGVQRSLRLCEEVFASFGSKMAAFGRGEMALPGVMAKAEALLAKIESAMPRMPVPSAGRGAQALALQGPPGPRAANQNALPAPTPRAQPTSSSSSSSSAVQTPVCVNDMRASLPERPIESFYYSN